MRSLKLIALAITIAMVTILGTIVILQLPWTKERMRSLLLGMAEKQGFLLQIGDVEGHPPLKWSFKDVKLQLNGHESLEIDHLALRIGIVSLLRGEFSISFLRANEMTIRYLPSQLPAPPYFPILSFPVSVKSLKIDQAHLINLSTEEELSFRLKGRGRVGRKAKQFWIETSVESSDLFASSRISGKEKGRRIEAHIDLEALSDKAFEPFFSLKKDLPFSATFDASLTVLKDGMFQVDEASLESPLLSLEGEGLFSQDFLPRQFSASLSASHLSYFSSYVDGTISGKATLNEDVFSLSLLSDHLTLGNLTYNQLALSQTCRLTDDGWAGPFSLKASHSQLPITCDGDVTFQPEKTLKFSHIEFSLPDTRASGFFLLDLTTFESYGSAIAQIFDLHRFSPLLKDIPLGGHVGLEVQFKGPSISLFIDAQNLRIYDLLTQTASIQAEVIDWLQAPKARLSVQMRTCYWDAFSFDTIDASSRFGESSWPYEISAHGTWKERLNLSSSGSWKLGDGFFDLSIETLEGLALKKPFSLQTPCSLHLTPTEFILSECALTIGQGYFRSDISLQKENSSIDIEAKHFPIDFLTLTTSRFTLQGNTSWDVHFKGPPQNLQGAASLILEGAEIFQTGKKIPIRSKGALQIHLEQEVAQVHGLLSASSEQFCEFSATLPIQTSLFHLGIDPVKPLSAELTMEGHLEDLFDFVNIGSQHTTGILSCHLLLSQTVQNPLLQGSFDWRQGTYENYFTGMNLHQISAYATAEGKQIHLHSISGKDESQGKLTGSGVIQLSPLFPFTFQTKAKNLKTFDLDWISIALTGPIEISGNAQQALAKGDVTVSKAEISIPKQFPADLPLLPVTFIHQPPHLKTVSHSSEPAYLFHYDAFFHAPKTIFLKGRGLDCELEGDLHVIGKNLSLDATGSLHLVRGKFAFAGKQFTLTQGEVSFIQDPSPGGYLNLSGTLSTGDVTITAILRGPLNAPALSFQSTPSLPTSSILARLLFNKDASELSAAQALQLADTIVTLSGESGPAVLETIRESLGIDRLNITSSDSDQIAVQIGKYLTQGVMITLSQSTESSQVIVEVELKGGFVLQAETQEDDQAKFSLKWNMNY